MALLFSLSFTGGSETTEKHIFNKYTFQWSRVFTPLIIFTSIPYSILDYKIFTIYLTQMQLSRVSAYFFKIFSKTVFVMFYAKSAYMLLQIYSIYLKRTQKLILRTILGEYGFSILLDYILTLKAF